MLAAVGCKDYDDDIDKINDRIDGLTTGKIADVESQLQSMQSVIDNLKTANEAINKEIENLKNDATAIDALKKAQEQLQKDIDAIEKNMVTSDLLTTTLSSYGITESVADAIKLAKGLKKYTNDGAIDAAIQAAQDAAVAAAGKALETAFETKLDAYYTKADHEAYDREIKKLINDAVADGGTIDTKIATAVAEAVKGMQATIASLGKDVDALIDRIQSLVNVPQYSDGTTDMNVYKVGSSEIGNAVAVLTYRATPAAAVKDIEALYASHPEYFAMLSEKVLTRAAEPETVAAAITGIEAGEGGKFSVTVSVANKDMAALTGKTIALALWIGSQVNPGTGAEDEIVSGVTNDVLSDFAGIKYESTAKAIEVKLFGEDNKEFIPETIRMPFNTSVADSKVTLLEKKTLMASFDGKNYMSLEDMSKLLGVDITAGAYTITPTYTDAANSPVTGETNIGKFIIKVTAPKTPSWNDQLATVEFRKAAESTDVKAKADVAHKIVMNVAGKASDKEVTCTTSYVISNQLGGTITFAEAKEMPWSYALVSNNGSNTTDKTPAFDAPVFGEVAVTVPDEIKLKLKEIMAGTLVKKVTATDDEGTASDVSGSADFTFSALVQDLAKGINVAVAKDAYAWNTKYDLEYTYTVNNVDYIIKGTIHFGAVPADVTYTFTQDAEYAPEISKKLAWADIYKAMATTGFDDVEEFVDAIQDGTTVPTPIAPAITRYAKASDKTGTDITAAGNGTAMTTFTAETPDSLKCVIKAADIDAVGNKFEHKAEWTTWYGQKITLTVNTTVTLGDYKLKPSDKYVVNGIAKAEGQVDPTTHVWAIDKVIMKDYFSCDPANALAKVEYVRKSTDGTPKNSVYPTYDSSDVKLEWKSGVNQLEVEMTAKLMWNTLLTPLATADFKVIATDPIKTFAAKALTAEYSTGTATEVDLLAGITLKDATDKDWIELKTGAKLYTPVTTGNGGSGLPDNGPEKVFGVTGTGASATATGGIVFGTPVVEDGLFSGNITITDGVLTIAQNQTVLQAPVTVTVPATFTYQFGEKKAEITITISPKK